jgi:hypothetical protein
MTKKWIAINLLLLTVSGLFGWYFLKSVAAFRLRNNTENIRPRQNAQPITSPDAVLSLQESYRRYNPAELSVITEKMVFSKDRSNIEVKPKTDPPPTPVVPALTPKPILQATLISDNERVALIIDPGDAPGTRRRAQVKRIGDNYKGYILTHITAEDIVFEAGTRRETIPLHQGFKQPLSKKTSIQEIRIVSIGDGKSNGTTGRTPSAGGSGAALLATIPSDVQQNPAGPGRGGTATPLPATPQPQQGQPFNVVGPTPDGRGLVLRTPFSDVVQPRTGNPEPLIR